MGSASITLPRPQGARKDRRGRSGDQPGGGPERIRDLKSGRFDDAGAAAGGANDEQNLAGGVLSSSRSGVGAHAGCVGAHAGLEALQWGKVARRPREVRVSLREDEDADISVRSLVTLRQTVRRVPRIPDPRIGSGESGILEAVWSFGDQGMLALDCREDGRLGCVILPSADGGAFSETLGVEAACALLDRLPRSGLLRRY